MLLYKYTSAPDALLILKDLTLYWSNIDKFNDPFEGRFIYDKTLFDIARIFTITLSVNHPALLNEPRLNKILDSAPKIKLIKRIKKLRDLLDYHYTTNTIIDQKTYFQVENEIYKHLQRNNPIELFNGEAANFTDPYTTAQVFINSTVKTSGVLCLSKAKNHPLMWAHYSKNHSGVMFEFDIEDNILNNNKKTIIKDVQYTKDIPKFTSDTILGINKDLFPDENEKMIELHVFSKSDHWKYEQEVRAITRKESPDKNIYEMDKKILKSIHFGIKTSQENKELILSLIKQKSLKTAAYETFLNKENYTIMSKKINF